MDAYRLQHTWLGTVITLNVATAFVWLSVVAIAYRAVVPPPPRP